MRFNEATSTTGKGERTKRSSRWAVRIAVYGAVGVFALLVYLERSARQAARETGKVWEQVVAERARNPRQELWQSELVNYIKGRPAAVRSDPVKYRSIARLLETYTWRGPFDEYQVEVYLGNVHTFIGRGDDWPVVGVVGTDASEDEE